MIVLNESMDRILHQKKIIDLSMVTAKVLTFTNQFWQLRNLPNIICTKLYRRNRNRFLKNPWRWNSLPMWKWNQLIIYNSTLQIPRLHNVFLIIYDLVYINVYHNCDDNNCIWSIDLQKWRKHCIIIIHFRRYFLGFCRYFFLVLILVQWSYCIEQGGNIMVASLFYNSLNGINYIQATEHYIMIIRSSYYLLLFISGYLVKQ